MQNLRNIIEEPRAQFETHQSRSVRKGRNPEPEVPARIPDPKTLLLPPQPLPGKVGPGVL